MPPKDSSITTIKSGVVTSPQRVYAAAGAKINIAISGSIAAYFTSPLDKKRLNTSADMTAKTITSIEYIILVVFLLIVT